MALSKEQQLEVKRLIEEGHSQQAVADRLGIGVATVQRLCSRRGWKQVDSDLKAQVDNLQEEIKKLKKTMDGLLDAYYEHLTEDHGYKV